jgi:hypothetical protein
MMTKDGDIYTDRLGGIDQAGSFRGGDLLAVNR